MEATTESVMELIHKAYEATVYIAQSDKLRRQYEAQGLPLPHEDDRWNREVEKVELMPEEFPPRPTEDEIRYELKAAKLEREYAAQGLPPALMSYDQDYYRALVAQVELNREDIPTISAYTMYHRYLKNHKHI